MMLFHKRALRVIVRLFPMIGMQSFERGWIRDIDIQALLNKATLIRESTSGFDPDEVRLSENGRAMVWLEKNNELMLWRDGSPTGPMQIPIEDLVLSIVAISPKGRVSDFCAAKTIFACLSI